MRGGVLFRKYFFPVFLFLITSLTDYSDQEGSNQFQVLHISKFNTFKGFKDSTIGAVHGAMKAAESIIVLHLIGVQYTLSCTFSVNLRVKIQNLW